MAKSSFGKIFLIALGIGGAAGIIAGLGDRAEAATPPKPPAPKPQVKKKRRKVASAEAEQSEEEAMVGGSPWARPLAYLYGVWPLIKSGISSHATMQQALRVAGSLWGNESFTKNGAREELRFVSTLVHELLRRLSMETEEVQAGQDEDSGGMLGPDYRTPEEKRRDAEKYAKYKKEYLDTPKGKQWQALQQTVSLVHWYRIDVKHISDLGNKPLTLTVQKFNGTTDYYPPGQEGKVLKLDRNGAFALAKKVADAFKKARGTDVVVEWTAAT
jgi:hypothetical protein